MVRQVTRILVCGVCLAYPSLAVGGDLALKLSTREAYLGEPVTVQIQVLNADAHDPPRFPEIAGARVDGGRSGTSRNISWINGKQTEQFIVTYSYVVTPAKPGKLHIPAIPVRVDGEILKTSPTTILVSTSETGDLLFVELSADLESIYLGQAIDVALEIWLRPYRSRNVRLDAEDMLGRIVFDGSKWGVFRDTVIRLRDGQMRWRYRQDTRQDQQGAERAYDVFVIPLQLVPTRTGPLDVGEVSVVVSYPTRIERERDPFFSSFSAFNRRRVTEARPVQASLGESTVLVKEPPAEGRPASFNGAVGDYKFEVQANPTNVRVREPIELVMTITGQGVLERVPPPPLAELPTVAREFKIPDENVAGTIESGRKRFAMTISARNADVTEIPSIPFAFFDPKTEQYVTRWSDPVPLEVEASDQVSVAQFAEAQQGTLSTPTQLTETAVGIRANYADMNDVLAQQAFDPGWVSVTLLLMCPLLYAIGALTQRHRDRLLHDRGFARRRRAGAAALAAIKAASRGSDASKTVSGLVNAVIVYISDRCDAPSGLTRAEAIDQLNARHVSARRIEQAEELLRRCEGQQYAGFNSELPADLTTQAREVIHGLERERF